MKIVWSLLLCGFALWGAHYQKAFAEATTEELQHLESLIGPEVLSEENTIEWHRLELDNPNQLSEYLMHLWFAHKDEDPTLLQARIIWFMSRFIDIQLLIDQKIDILPLLDRTIAWVEKNRISVPIEELQYARFRLEIAQDSKGQSEHIQELMGLARKVRNPQSRAKLLGDLVHGMADRGEFIEQLPAYLNEIRLLLGETRRDYNAGDVYTLSSLSHTLVSIGRSSEAHAIEKSLQDLCKRLVMRSFCAMQSYETGLELIKTDKIENAERSKDFFLRSLEQSQPIHDTDYIALSYYGLNIAFNKTKQFAEAIPYGLKAFETYQALGSAVWQASTLKNLASSYLGIKNYTKALQTAEAALKICPQEYSIDLMKIYDKLAEIHEAMGHDALALKYLRLSNQKKDEANTEDANKKYMELRNEALSQQNALQQEQISLLNKFKLASLIAASLSLMLALVLLLVWHQARTIKISRQKMKDVLDNIDEGIVVLDRHLKIEKGYSPFVDKIFQKPPQSLEGADLLELLLGETASSSGESGVWRESLLMCIGEQSLSWDLNATHLPREIILGKQILSLHWQPLFNLQHSISSYLISMRDISDLRAIEQHAARESERVQLVHQILQEILAGKINLIRKFVHEAHLAWQKMDRGPLEANQRLILRQLHSWKGGARSLGLKKLAESLHETESWIISGSSQSEPGHRLSQWLSTYDELLQSLTVHHGDEVAKDLYSYSGVYSMDMQTRLDQVGIPYQGVLVLDRILRWSPDVLNRIHDILLHALSNALDHGFIRHRQQQRNPSPPALIQMIAAKNSQGIELLVIDNGKGIDWDWLRKKAQDQGRTSLTQESLVSMLFEDGFSTAEVLSTTSGRGVGLSAIRSICEELGGHITLADTPGGGTTLRLEFPKL